MDDRFDDRLPPAENPLLECCATSLAAMIARKEVSSRDVVDAFLDRIDAVNEHVRAVCWPLFDQARAAAQAADERQARGESVGPLHGVPVTIKECFHIAGTPSTMGLTTLADAMQSAEGPLVSRLKSAGAIVLGKTNVPQLMILHETENPLCGRTTNPRDLARTPGGSSGGEGAIIAARGSPLGLGSDLGGSIRIPAHFCGVCGIKPSSFRLTKSGTVENMRGMEALQFQPGPLARRVKDLDLALRVMTGGRDWATDGFVTPADWPDFRQLEIAKLNVGVIRDDGYAAPHLAVRRAVDEAASALSDAGANVKDIEPPDVEEGMELYFAIVGADGAADLRELAAGSELDRRVRAILRLGGVSGWRRRAMAAGLRWQGQTQLANLVAAAGPRSAHAYWQTAHAAKQYARNYLASLAQNNIDAIVCPPHARPAFVHGQGGPPSLIDASYAFIMNLLGLPCGVVPWTNVSAGEGEAAEAGLPIGVQVAAGPWREDIVLKVLQVLEDNRPTASCG